MELKNRINLLIQSAELAQQNGALTLDDAVMVKAAIDSIKDDKNVKDAVKILIKTAQVAQKNGVFSLKDAFFVYMAIDGIDEEFEQKNDETKKGEE